MPTNDPTAYRLTPGPLRCGLHGELIEAGRCPACDERDTWSDAEFAALFAEGLRRRAAERVHRDPDLAAELLHLAATAERTLPPS